MNKLIVAMIGLCNIFVLIGMEDRKAIAVTSEENARFICHVSMAVNYSNKVVKEQKISKNNALHIITNMYPDLLVKANNDLVTMINNQGLDKLLGEYISLETDSEIIEYKKRLVANNNDNEAKSLLIKRRESLSNDILEKVQPTYSRPLSGEVQTNARLDFMQRNNNYPLDEKAINDYIATFIYQYILARRVAPLNDIKV